MISLANTLGQMTINRNSPANDSGFYQTQSLNANSNDFQTNFLSGISLNNAVFSVIIIGVIVLLLTGGSRITTKKKSVLNK
jgi:hypothetical protein